MTTTRKTALKKRIKNKWKNVGTETKTVRRPLGTRNVKTTTWRSGENLIALHYAPRRPRYIEFNSVSADGKITIFKTKSQAKAYAKAYMKTH